jgi:hypothetical protein
VKPKLGWLSALIALSFLGLAMFTIAALGKPDYRVFPSSLNSQPGGTLGAAAVLERAGVKLERLYVRPLRQETRGKVVLVFLVNSAYYFEEEEAFSNSVAEDFPLAKAIVVASLTEKLPPRDIPELPAMSEFPAFKRVKRISAWPAATLQGEQRMIPLQTTEQRGVLAEYRSDAKIPTVYITSGSSLLNRFIGKADNAEMLLAIIKSLAPNGETVVLPEYFYGVTAPDNLFTRLGPSYSASAIQAALMFALLIYALGKRFGYPEVDAVAHPGAPRYFRAIGELFRRGRSTDVVLEAALNRALRIAGKKHALGADLSKEEKLRRIPGKVGELMRTIWTLSSTKVSPKDALRLTAQLEEELKRL